MSGLYEGFIIYKGFIISQQDLLQVRRHCAPHASSLGSVCDVRHLTSSPRPIVPSAITAVYGISRTTRSGSYQARSKYDLRVRERRPRRRVLLFRPSPRSWSDTLIDSRLPFMLPLRRVEVLSRS